MISFRNTPIIVNIFEQVAGEGRQPAAVRQEIARRDHPRGVGIVQHQFRHVVDHVVVPADLGGAAVEQHHLDLFLFQKGFQDLVAGFDPHRPTLQA